MKTLHIKKVLAVFICFLMLLSFLFTFKTFAGQNYGTDPGLGIYGLYDTTCNKCGQDNPEWLQEHTVHYCKNCGGLGMPMLIEEKKPEKEESKDDDEDWDYDDEDEDEDEEIPFEVIIGGAAVGGAAVIMINRARKKAASKKGGKSSSGTNSNKTKKEQKKDQPSGYILNISQDNVFVTPQTPAQIAITVLRVLADGKTKVEPSAPITVSLKPDSSIQVLPLNGFGQVMLSISQKDTDPKNSEEYINIAATVPGAQKTAQVKVSIAQNARVVFF